MSITFAIILFTALVSFIGFSKPAFKSRLMYTSAALKRNQFERLLTNGFVHADLGHLLFNMLTLFFFGLAVEKALSPLVYLGFYLTAVVVAILPTWWAEKNNMRYASLGASGAVCAVLYFYVLKNPTSTLYFFGVIPVPAVLFAVGFVVYGLVEQKRGSGRINHSAHLTGSAYGVLAALIL